MEENLKKKVYLNHCAVHLKLTQHCKSTIPQLEKKKKKDSFFLVEQSQLLSSTGNPENHFSSSYQEARSMSSFYFYTLDLIFYHFFFLSFLLFRAAPAAYGGYQARGRIGATAAGRHHSHSNAESEPLCLQPTPQLTATPDPRPTEQGQN